MKPILTIILWEIARPVATRLRGFVLRSLWALELRREQNHDRRQ